MPLAFRSRLMLSLLCLLSPARAADRILDGQRRPLYAGVLAVAFMLVGWRFNLLAR